MWGAFPDALFRFERPGCPAGPFPGPGLDKWNIIAFQRSALEESVREKIYHHFSARFASLSPFLLPGPCRPGPGAGRLVNLSV